MYPKTETRHSARRWAGVGASLAMMGAALLLATPAAYADSSANIEGARATFTSDGEVFRLYDTACDAHPVFLDYTFQGQRHRIDFSGGCNKSGTYDLSLPEGKTITYKACVNIQGGPDRCSGTSTDVT